MMWDMRSLDEAEVRNARAMISNIFYSLKGFLSAMSTPRVSRRALLGGAAVGTAAGCLTMGAAVTPWSQELISSASAAPLRTSESPDLAAATDEAGTFPIRILFNENPLGCSPAARKAVQETLTQTHFYPFDIAAQLTAKLRAAHGMAPLPESTGLSLKGGPEAGDHKLMLAGGSSELLLAVGLAYSVEGGNLVEPEPSYQSVGSTTQARPGASMQLRRIPLAADGGLDVDGMLAACDKQTRIMVVTNPNNPTGTVLAKDQLKKLISQTPAHVLILVDEAYIDFLDDAAACSAVPLALQNENVLVTRTFSKIHGLAGLRAGYGIGHRSIFERLRPFQVGSLSLNACGLVAAMASLDDSNFQQKSRTMAADSRSRISKQLVSLGYKVSNSQAACLWVDFGKDSAPMVRSLADRGVLISGGMRWDSPNFARISVGTKWQTTKLLEAITDLA